MPPRKKFKPAVKKGVIMAGFLGLFAFCGLAFLLEMAKKFNKDDEHTKEFLRNIEGIKGDAAKVGRLVGLGKKKRGVRP
jgi:Na+-driven multidrug efflux pump